MVWYHTWILYNVLGRDGFVLVTVSVDIFQDSVTINVVPLEKVRIYAPLRQLETGTSMPLYALGRDSHQGPIAYASAIPPLAIDWSLSDKQAAHLVGIYSEVSHE